MRTLRNKNEPPTGLVQKFIGSAYDTVKIVADNIADVVRLGQAIEDGADLVTDVEMQIYVAAELEAALVNGMDFRGDYDPVANNPDLTDPVNVVKVGDTFVVTLGGTFFGEPVAPGDLIIAQVDNPTIAAEFSVINRNVDEDNFATAAQGALADSAVQPEDLGTAADNDEEDFATAAQGLLADTAVQPEALGTAASQDSSAFATAAQGAVADSALQPGANVSELTNDANYITLADVPAAGDSIGYTNIREIVDAGYTLVDGDQGRLIIMNSDSDYGIALSGDTLVPEMPVGTRVDILSRGTGKVTIAPAIGASMIADVANPAILTENRAVAAAKIGAELWVVWGAEDDV